MKMRALMLVALGIGLAGCSGSQSALDPAGLEAGQVRTLFWVLLAGAIVLWVAVNGLFFYVTRLNPRPLSRKLAETVIIGGGIVMPVVVLGALLSYALPMMSDQRAEGTDLTLRITAERWWWRVEYVDKETGETVVAANEVRLPVGQRAELELNSAKVIHSFWIPALAGKMDMFPGRQTRLALQPERTGEFRGQCAEFCGASHALMAFKAVVMEPDDFEAWLERERGDAPDVGNDPAGELGKGRAVFMAEGCGACHTVRGTPARGQFGPDLTHVGSRRSIGAGILPPEASALERWIRHTELLKPEVEMPSYEHLDDGEIKALGAWLQELI